MPAPVSFLIFEWAKKLLDAFLNISFISGSCRFLPRGYGLIIVTMLLFASNPCVSRDLNVTIPFYFAILKGTPAGFPSREANFGKTLFCVILFDISRVEG